MSKETTGLLTVAVNVRLYVAQRSFVHRAFT